MDPHSKTQNLVEMLSQLMDTWGTLQKYLVNREVLASAPVKLRQPKCGFPRVLKTFRSSNTTWFDLPHTQLFADCSESLQSSCISAALSSSSILTFHVLTQQPLLLILLQLGQFLRRVRGVEMLAYLSAPQLATSSLLCKALALQSLFSGTPPAQSSGCSSHRDICSECTPQHRLARLIQRLRYKWG